MAPKSTQKTTPTKATAKAAARSKPKKPSTTWEHIHSEPSPPIGKRLRNRLPRADQAKLILPDDRDPLSILEKQHESRLQDLVPVRIGRMLESPFAYYRGTAAVMAADLRDAPDTGVDVVACGDAHISNFGFYATPERELIFDLNDFDEAAIAPWEWDVRRLAASVHIGGRASGLSEEQCGEATLATVNAYGDVLRGLMSTSAIDRFYFTVDSSTVAKQMGDVAAKAISKATKRTSAQVLSKIEIGISDGTPVIIDQPPILRHVTNSYTTRGQLVDLFDEYRGTVSEDVGFFLGQFRVVDFVLRVVGVGSVGTRCYLLALTAQGQEVLFIQAKEAQESVLNSFGGRPRRIPSVRAAFTQGHRVVAAQRVLQAHSDPFLGWISGQDPHGRRQPGPDYYCRQFRDMKGSIEPSQLTDAGDFTRYGELCAGLLARAHSQTASGGYLIAGYIGASTAFAEATAKWARAYADVSERDYASLQRAVKKGRFPCEPGV